MQKLLGYRSRGAVDRAEAQGVVPKSFRLGSGSRRWRLSAVRAAIKALEEAANANPLA
jgi:predicted DNA-binding transcriptional regulator AlpA